MRVNNYLVIFLHGGSHWRPICLYGLVGSAEPINSVAIQVSKNGGEKFLGIWLCLAPAQDLRQVFEWARLRGC